MPTTERRSFAPFLDGLRRRPGSELKRSIGAGGLACTNGRLRPHTFSPDVVEEAAATGRSTMICSARLAMSGGLDYGPQTC